jgi:DNA-binding NtrC family response regulator
MAETGSIRILVVEDDRAVSEALCDGLRGRGHTPVSAGSLAEGLERLAQAEFDVGLVGLTLPDGSGTDILRRVSADGMAMELIVLTGYATVTGAIEAMKLGAYDYVAKPPRMEEVEILVSKAAEKARLRREVAGLKARLSSLDGHPGMLTEDPAMRDLLAAAERAAAGEMPVLIQGETGTGRQLLARLIHRDGRRADQPFVTFRCAALPEALIEGELFGQEKGPAAVRRAGVLEMAAGGVLFFDEVSDLPPLVQVKLLRALDGQDYFRVGGSRALRADVRVIAATAKNLKAEAAAAGYRDDLYQRLSAVTLKVPALRERAGDIALLARHFVERYAPRKRLSGRALDALQRYPWPGNVRELQIVMQRAAALSPRDVIEAEDLPGDLRDPGGKGLPFRAGLSLAEMEREYIEAVLRQNEGHRGKTARALGIDPKTLYNKLGPERPRKKIEAR